MRIPCTYILGSLNGNALYVGVTANLVQRLATHRAGTQRGFTCRYRCHRLLWFECHADMASAIIREKQLKAGSRQRKIDLIVAMNPNWLDLAFFVIEERPFPPSVRLTSRA